MNLAIRPLEPGLLGEYLHFFDSVAFSDNHDWEGCYCVYYQHRCTLEEWNNRTREENRAEAISLIEQRILHGYLAFCGSDVVGWCNVNSKNEYGPHLSESLRRPDDNRTAAIVCFLIAPAFRRQGIASQLLERVLADLGQNDMYDFIEAYPRKGASTDAAHYHGPTEMYLKCGFRVEGETEDSIVLRKALH